MRWGILLTLAATGCVDLGPDPAVDHDVVSLGPAGSTATVTLPRQSAWAYDVSGQDLGKAWRTGGGDWTRGDAPLGYGEAYVATTVPTAQTAYFRRDFTLRDVEKIRRLYLRVMYDDGVVIYVNGHEAGRASMPGGPVVYGTLAAGHEAQDAYVTFDLSSQIPNLVGDATNSLAIEVHQQARSSSDLVFDAELITWIDDAAEPVSSRADLAGAYWMYWDGAALGS